MIVLFLVFIRFCIGKELYDFRSCYQENMKLNVVAHIPKNETQSTAIIHFLDDLDRIRNTVDDNQRMRVTLLHDFVKYNYQDTEQCVFKIEESKWDNRYENNKLFVDGKLSTRIIYGENSTYEQFDDSFDKSFYTSCMLAQKFIDEMHWFNGDQNRNFYIIILIEPIFNIYTDTTQIEFLGKFEATLNEKEVQVLPIGYVNSLTLSVFNFYLLRIYNSLDAEISKLSTKLGENFNKNRIIDDETLLLRPDIIYKEICEFIRLSKQSSDQN